MALAFIEYAGRAEDGLEFRLDIGVNRYFAYEVGERDRTDDRGLVRLARPSFVSPLQGPLGEEHLGRARLVVPAHLFDREHRHLQLASFRTASREGPALSEIVAVPLVDLDEGGRRLLPARRDSTMSAASSVARGPASAGVSPFRYRERPVDSAMFLDGLGSLLGTVFPGLAGVLPVADDVAGAVEHLIEGSGRTAPPPAPGAAPASGDGLKRVLELIDRVARAVKADVGAPPRPAAAPGKAPAPAAAPAGAPAPAPDPSLTSPTPIAAEESWARAAALGPPYSRAQVAPALAALLTPQMITAISDSLVKIGDLALKNDANLRNFVKELNPGVDDASLDALLQSLSVEVAQPAQDVPFQPIPAVTLSAVAPAPQRLGGRARTLLRAGQDLGFRFTVATPKPISRAHLLLSVKEPGTLRILARKGFRLDHVTAGPLSPDPIVPRAVLAPLAAGADYLLSATLVWSGKRGHRLGAATAIPFTLVGSYAVDRLAEEGEVRRLDDVERHREFWHKAWQTSLDDKVRSYDLDAKYYYSVDAAAPANARLETLVRPDGQKLWAVHGRLKSGLVLSLAELNALLPALGKPALDPAQLDALRSPEFVERFSRAARVKLSFRGRPGDSVALWVYPEIRLQTVVLKQVRQVDPLGAVTGVADAPVAFPFPLHAHFVGTSTQS